MKTGKGRGHEADRGGRRDPGTDTVPGSGGPGRSEQSPGHLKKQAGEQSARDFAPGHQGVDGRPASPDRGEGERPTH